MFPICFCFFLFLFSRSVLFMFLSVYVFPICFSFVFMFLFLFPQSVFFCVSFCFCFPNDMFLLLVSVSVSPICFCFFMFLFSQSVSASCFCLCFPNQWFRMGKQFDRKNCLRDYIFLRFCFPNLFLFLFLLLFLFALCEIDSKCCYIFSHFQCMTWLLSPQARRPALIGSGCIENFKPRAHQHSAICTPPLFERLLSFVFMFLFLFPQSVFFCVSFCFCFPNDMFLLKMLLYFLPFSMYDLTSFSPGASTGPHWIRMHREFQTKSASSIQPYARHLCFNDCCHLLDISLDLISK